MNHSINRDQIEAILNEIGNEDYDDVIHEDYSGRGMFGDRCLGYSGVDEHVFSVGLALAVAGIEGEFSLADIAEAQYAIGAPQRDSLGKGRIVYWPNVQIDSE